MEKLGGIFVNFNTGTQQILVEHSSGPLCNPDIALGRHEKADINPSLGGTNQSTLRAAVGYEIGSSQPNSADSMTQAAIEQAAQSVPASNAVIRHQEVGAEPFVLDAVSPEGMSGFEQPRRAPCDRSRQAYVQIAPSAFAAVSQRTLLAYVEPSNIGYTIVDHEQLAVVATLIAPRLPPVPSLGPTNRDSRVSKDGHGGLRKDSSRSQSIKAQLDFNTTLGRLQESMDNLTADMVLLEYVHFKQDPTPSFPDVSVHRLEQVVSLREDRMILDIGLSILQGGLRIERKSLCR